MKAKDVMTANVVTVVPRQGVADIARVLVENQISAVPVVDGKGRILGVVSEGDLLRRMDDESEDHPEWWFSLVAQPEDFAEAVVRVRGLTARDVMTSPPVSVADDADIGDVAELLVRRRLKRVPVIRGGKLVGMVSRTDVLRGLAGLG